MSKGKVAGEKVSPATTPRKSRPLYWYYSTIEQADADAELLGPNLVTIRKSRVSDGWLIEIY